MRIHDRLAWAGLLALLVSLLPACRREAPDAPALGNRLKLATTTSTDNSGLLVELLPPFETRYGIAVDVIAVGTGKALKLGETGDVDAVLVHARAAEDAFVAAGYGVNRRDVMHNDFVLLGPASDPAGVKGLVDAAEALRRIASSRSPFASRGDDSGTHKKEKALWTAAGVSPGGRWYMETGQGMGATLTVADEKAAYVLTDRGTYLAFRDRIDLPILAEGDPRLFNPYGIIAVNPARHEGIAYVEAMLLIAWVTSPRGQAIIGGFRKEGKVLFHPDAVRTGEGGS